MAELLQYDFAVVGTANVERALASLERRFAQHNAKMNTLFGRNGAGAGGPSRGARAGNDGMAGAAAVREQTTMLKKLERDQIASAKRVERERISTEKAVGREQVRQQKYWDNAQSKSRERQHALMQEEATIRAEFVKSTVGKGFGRVMGGVRAVGMAGLTMTGVGGAALAASAISQAAKLDDTSRRLAIQGRGVGEVGADPDQLRKKFTSIGIETGMAPEAVAEGASAYVGKTGDLKGAMDQLKVFGTVAQATGADIRDIASAAADLRKLGVTSIDEVSKSLTILAMQGKSGAFEIKNMAQYLPSVLSSAASSNVKGVAGMASIGGLLQVTQNTTGDAAESATGVIDMFAELKKNASKMASGEAYGGHKVNVFEGGNAKNAMRPLRDIVGDTMMASQFDSSQVQHSFGLRGIKPLEGIFTAGKETRLAALKAGDTDKVATEKGKQAGLAVWDKAANVHSDFSEIERDARDAMKGFSVQMDILQTQLKDVVASQLFPRLVELAPALKEMLPAFASLVKNIVDTAGFFAEHPFAGLGAAVTASILYEIASAKLGTVVAGALTQSMAAGVAAQVAAGGGVGGVVAGARAAVNGGGAVGTLGAAALAAGGVYAAYDQGKDLQKTMGGSFAAALPGFDAHGGFDMSRLGSDLWSPLDSASKKSDQAMNDTARADRASADAATAQAAKDQAQAAKDQAANVAKFGAVVDKLGGNVNRGNSPSPVKP